MITSPSITILISALAHAQAKFETILKDKQGQEGYQKFPYAPLPNVLKAVQPYLNQEGIFVTQSVVIGSDNRSRITTRVQLGDEFMQTDGLLLSDAPAGKNLGKEITYGRRIDFCALFSVVGEEDEDAPLPKKVNDPSLARTKNDPLPPEMYDDNINRVSGGLTEEARKIAEEMEQFVPLTEQRNTQIQDRLKKIIADKLMDRRKLSVFLDKTHDGKKALEVSATQWESTMKKIEEAINAGPETIKALLKGDA